MSRHVVAIACVRASCLDICDLDVRDSFPDSSNRGGDVCVRWAVLPIPVLHDHEREIKRVSDQRANSTVLAVISSSPASGLTSLNAGVGSYLQG